MLYAFANGTLFGQRWGGGDAVLALHGWSGSSGQMQASCSSFDTTALDLPGFGASVAPPSPWGAADYAKAVAPVLDEFAGPVVLVGYSFGGRVAVELAYRHPEKIRALVLTGVPLLRRAGKRKGPMSYRFVRWAHRRGIVSDDQMERARRNNGSADYRAATGVMRDVLVRVVNETYEEQLKGLKMPVHMVWGTEDTAAPAWIVEEARALIPHDQVRVTMIEGANHWFPMHNPGRLTLAIKSELEGGPE